MKKIQFLAICGLMAAWAFGARAMNDVRPAAVTVVGITGEARYSVDGHTWRPLVLGKIVREGAVIETAAGSTCDLVISGTPVSIAPGTIGNPAYNSSLGVAPDPEIRGFVANKPMAAQNVIRMSPGTMLAIDKLTYINTGADSVSDTELDLRAGKIFTSVKKTSASSQYIIKLPNGVAGIRGSKGMIGADGSAAMLEGTVVISFIGSNGQPHVVVVHNGFSYNPATGEITSLPEKVIKELKADGAYSATLFAEVRFIAQLDITLVFISPTQGIPAAAPASAGGAP